MKKLFLAMIAGGMLTIGSGSALANSLEQMQIEFLNDDTNIVKFNFSENADKPKILKSKENEILLQFSDLTNEMKESFFSIQESGIKNISIDEVDNNILVQINLVSKHSYAFSYLDNKMILELKKDSVSYADIENVWKFNSELKINDIDFVRHSNEHSDIVISHNEKDPQFDVIEFDGGVEFTFDEASIPSKLFQKKNVSEYSTPIDSYLTKIEDGKVSLKIFYNPNYKASYVTTRLDDKFVIIIKGEDYNQKYNNGDISNNGDVAVLNKNSFDGDLISFDLQDVPIKSALFVIAKKMNLNLVMGDNISGRITLLLNDVPHDQALDIILRTKGLGKYIEGSILLVAPLEEIVQRQEFELSSKEKIIQISPLKSDTIQIKYAKSSEVFVLLETVKSDRGKIIFDERTNKMFLEDTAKKLFEMKSLVEEIDIPVRQVSVEARIVYANKSVNEEMGVQWNASAGTNNVWSDSFDNIGGSNVGIKDGSSLGGNGANTAKITLGFMNANVDATLTALEKVGDVEIIARPLVIAANKQKSRISSGKQYPYIEISENGDITTTFKEIVLSLDVTPQITPNNKLILDLEIIQDSIAELTDAGPALNSTRIKTQVIVSDQETLVLGGVFKESIIKSESRVPILSDIPLLGKLFTSTIESKEEVELLIFITPRIITGDEIIRQ